MRKKENSEERERTEDGAREKSEEAGRRRWEKDPGFRKDKRLVEN